MRAAIAVTIAAGLTCISRNPASVRRASITRRCRTAAAAIEPTVACANCVLPADVELLRKAGGWQIGHLETGRVSAIASSIIAANADSLCRCPLAPGTTGTGTRISNASKWR